MENATDLITVFMKHLQASPVSAQFLYHQLYWLEGMEQINEENEQSSASILKVAQQWFSHKLISILPEIRDIPIPEGMECKGVMEDEASGFNAYFFDEKTA